MSKVKKSQLQPPFRQKDLITATQFVSFCSKYGIRTDVTELEYYEKEWLLLPAIRVNRGVIEYKRVLADYQKGDEE